MTQGDATPTSQQVLYTKAALDLMRARIEDLRGKPNEASALLFLGRNFALVQELHRCWDALPAIKGGLPCPGDVWSWL